MVEFYLKQPLDRDGVVVVVCESPLPFNPALFFFKVYASCIF